MTIFLLMALKGIKNPRKFIKTLLNVSSSKFLMINIKPIIPINEVTDWLIPSKLNIEILAEIKYNINGIATILPLIIIKQYDKIESVFTKLLIFIFRI